MISARTLLRIINESNDLESVLDSLTHGVKDAMVRDLEHNMIKAARISLKIIKDEKITYPGRQKDRLPGLPLIDLGGIPNSGMADLEKIQMKDDHEELAAELAEKAIDRILKDFENKIISKIEKVTDRLGTPEIQLLNHYSNQGQLSAEIRFTFGKAHFTAKTQIVAVWNNNGTNFVRYPLTFHDVVLSDGTQMKSPSEKKMISDFK